MPYLSIIASNELITVKGHFSPKVSLADCLGVGTVVDIYLIHHANKIMSSGNKKC